MLERRGNRFHPQASLSSRGTLGVLIGRAWRRVRRAGIKAPYTKDELELTSTLVEFLAFREDWQKVAEMASRTIVRGCGPKARVRFYRAWLEALRALDDVEGLQSLGRHMLLLRHEGADYVALACLALTHAGRRAYARTLYGHLVKNVEKKSVLVWEAMAQWLAESPSAKERAKGVEMFALQCSRAPSYFSLRSYLIASLDADSLEHAASAYNFIHEEFPLAPEPYLASARLAMSENDFTAASVTLQQLLADNPRNVEGLLALSHCFEKSGDLLAARDLLSSNEALFDCDDVDFNSTLGIVDKKLHERYGMAGHHQSAVRHLSVALRACEKMQLPQGAVHAALLALGAGVGEQIVAGASGHDETLWMLAADESVGNDLMERKDVILRAPQGVTRGQLILLTRPNPRMQGVELVCAVFEVTSPLVPDREFGWAVSARLVKTLSSPLEVELHDVRYPHRDGWGCENFARDHYARFYELPLAEASELLTLVEHDATASHATGERLRAG